MYMSDHSVESETAKDLRAGEAEVTETAAMISPVDNPVARTEEAPPALEPQPLIAAEDETDESDSAVATSSAPDEEFTRLRQMATTLAHDAARVLLDAADGEGSFRGGDIKRKELNKLKSSVMDYLREHERRTGKRIFDDVEDRQVLGLD
jgi:hypothetical protein